MVHDSMTPSRADAAVSPSNQSSVRRDSLAATIRSYLELVRFSHTLFALPFAFLALAWSLATPLPDELARSVWSWQRWLGVLICMVTARNFAMAFNRWCDASIDAKNPRTQSRHLPAGILSQESVMMFILFNGLAFVASCLLFLPNQLPVWLSLPVLGWIASYSLAKRWTALVHWWLGASLMMAPVCTWIAIRGELVQANWMDLAPPVWMGLSVMMWVAGFDIIYSCQDAEVDRALRLNSTPSRWGVRTALRVAAICHLLMWMMLAVMPLMFTSLSLGWIWWSGLAIIGGLLLYEHSIVSEKDLGRVNTAFFHMNVLVGLGLALFGSVDAFLR